jgi:hypothetical protein
MSSRERHLWAEFVCKREERKDEKQARKRRAKKPQPTQLAGLPGNDTGGRWAPHRARAARRCAVRSRSCGLDRDSRTELST